MPGGIEQSRQLRTFYGIQTAKGKGAFKTQSIYGEKEGATAIMHANQLEQALPKHQVQVVPVTREGVPVGEPIPHKLEVPKLQPKQIDGQGSSLPAPKLKGKAYDLTSGEAKRVN